MKFEESDIDFGLLDSNQFEELCFDLLMRIGFQELQWRKGGADSGRDIDGKYFIHLPLVEGFEETWAIECKNYTSGVPVEAIASKLSWAEAERPDRLVVIVSSYLTNSARSWLEKRRPQIPCRIHVVEGKALKKLLLSYDNIVERYFGYRYSKLLRQSFETWSLHGLMPAFDTLIHMVKHLSIDKLEGGELAFLWCLCQFKNSEIEKWEEETGQTFPIAVLVDALRPLSIGDSSVLEPYSTLLFNGSKIERWRGDGDKFGTQALVCDLLVQSDDGPKIAMYGFELFSDDQGLESIVCASSRPEASIRYVSKGAVRAFEAAKKLLDEYEKTTRDRRRQKTDIS